MNELLEHDINRQVVIVDDDDLFRESLTQNLLDTGYAANGFGDGPAALAYLQDMSTPDIILLDWRMPRMTGIEVLRQIRKLKVDVPVVFLTVLSDQIFEEAGLLGGAVDFIEKSRSFSILQRRIELILAGYKGVHVSTDEPRESAVLKKNSLVLRNDINRAFWKGRQVDLTLTEFRIVERLVRRSGQDVQYRELYDIVHGVGFSAGDGEVGFRTNVRALIKRIRQKFRTIDGNFRQIENYPGFGYRWSEGDEG